MADDLLSASKVLLYMASFYGWGRLVNRWSGGNRLAGWAFPAALGIAFLIAVGGILNSVGFARPIVLLSLYLTGLGLAIFFACGSVHDYWKNKPPGRQSEEASKPFWYTPAYLVYFALILSVFIFLVMVLMPARSFNFHDDFHVYLMWPLRMLQTGSLGGNYFDHIGLSSLGGQSFMHGMALTFGKISEINSFDAIICLILTLALLKELGELIGTNPVFIIVAGLLAIFINPHYANITSLYSGSLMLLGMVYASVLLMKSYGSSTTTGLTLKVMPCSLFYAALLTMKATYVFVPPLFWGAAFLGSLLVVKEKKQVLVANFAGALATIFLLTPWISLYWDRYLRKIGYILNHISYPQETTTTSEVMGDLVATLLSNNVLFYGNTYRDYLHIVMLLFMASAVTGWSMWKTRNRQGQATMLLVPFLAIFLSAIISFGLQYIFGPARLVVRYSCPILIGAAPVTVLMAGWLWKQGRCRLPGCAVQKKVAITFSIILLLAQLGLIMVFRQTFELRVQRAYNHETLLQFPLAEDTPYKLYNDYALSEQAKTRMMTIQKMVPPGETIFAWVAMPFHLDFARNPLQTTNDTGMAYNLLVMPLAEGTGAMEKFFNQFGIRYIIWDYNSYGVKRLQELGSLQLNFIGFLEEIIVGSKVIFNDGQIILMDIGRQN